MVARSKCPTYQTVKQFCYLHNLKVDIQDFVEASDKCKSESVVRGYKTNYRTQTGVPKFHADILAMIFSFYLKDGKAQKHN